MKKLYQLYIESSGVTTDTRQIKPYNLFFALKGERFNGNKFALQALEQGASYAIVDEKEKAIDDRYILVDNVLETLQQLANYHRKQLTIPVIGITGTNGKTTTKELLSTVLATTYRTHFTKGNLNNHIGVPLTLLSIPKDTEMAVVEMGANHKGEIAFLANIAEPSHGLVTNVGRAHLEGFGSFEGVIQTKSELYQYLAKSRGTAFVNSEEPHLIDMAGGCSNIIAYNRQSLGLEHIGSTPFLKLEWNGTPFITQILGQYNFANIMTAVAVGNYFKVSTAKIIEGIISYLPKNNRSQWIKKSTNNIILDAYNANPTSMAVALQNLEGLDGERKVAVLGDMLELGTESEVEHRKILELAADLDITVITVGTAFCRVNKDNTYLSIQDLKKNWDWSAHENTIFLLKGSRGIRIEKLLED